MRVRGGAATRPPAEPTPDTLEFCGRKNRAEKEIPKAKTISACANRVKKKKPREKNRKT
jgi:hypothetical protein